MTEKFTYNQDLLPPPEEEITFRDMLILALQIQQDMITTKKLMQSINDGITKQSSTTNKDPEPKQNRAPFMNQKIQNSDRMSTEEVMQWLKLSKRTLQIYRNEGKIPFDTFNGRIYYSKSEIEKCFEKHEVKSTNEK